MLAYTLAKKGAGHAVISAYNVQLLHLTATHRHSSLVPTMAYKDAVHVAIYTC